MRLFPAFRATLVARCLQRLTCSGYQEHVSHLSCSSQAFLKLSIRDRGPLIVE